MPSDIEIAQRAKMLRITKVAEKLGIPEEHLEWRMGPKPCAGHSRSIGPPERTTMQPCAAEPHKAAIRSGKSKLRRQPWQVAIFFSSRARPTSPTG